MNDRLFIKLQVELGAGSPAFGALMRRFGSVEAVFSATPSQLKENVSAAKAARILNGDFAAVDEIIEVCRKNGIDIITYADPRFPERLRNIPDPPALLYCKGELPQMDDQVAIAIVGPRKTDDYGRKAAFSLSARLARAGAVNISGGALGVDTEVHAGSLWSGGKTVAVLGCGLLFSYLKSNAKLRDDIAKQGAVITEFPPYASAFRANFPLRNRIMSGLALGTVVIQASIKSGALITARHAIEQGRDVFVVPGQPGDKLYEGSNLLLKDGAKPVLSAVDILEEYVERYPHRLLLDRLYSNDGPSISQGFKAFHTREEQPVSAKPSQTIPAKAEVKDISASETAKKVYAAVTAGADTLDTLTENTDLTTAELISALTELEICGYISAAVGGRYKITD